MIPSKMRAARMYDAGAPMVIEDVPVPRPGPLDVLVRVRACGIVPNLGNVLSNWTTWFPQNPLPKLPATFGLDPAGEIAALGSGVSGVSVGQRVYVNPGRVCGSCRACRSGEMTGCVAYTFQGYFGFGPGSQQLFDRYPYGGLSEYIVAPAYALVALPDNVTFEQAARFGYIGTAYSALRKAGARPSSTVLINGASGTLGLGGVISALAMGVTCILGTGRNRDLLEEVKCLAPERIAIHALEDGPISHWARGLTGGEGVDIVIDCLGPGAPGSTLLDAMRAMRRGGRTVNIGAVMEMLPMDVHSMMDASQSFMGSLWFTPGEGEDLARMAGVGTLDLSILRTNRFLLSDVNDVLAGIQNRHGGFSNYVVTP
ncbi:MAG: alcohol dehydrogenase [Rhodospirillaceae bacterium]|nr:MAG: alcohol dehydrogenase [Rhodospirillaceae bacterium]